MASVRFDTVKIVPLFNNYKLNRTKDDLDDLYNSIDYVVLTVTRNISKKFRQKNLSDFEDLQQQVRLDIYRYLPRILENCIDAEQLVRIVVAATVIRYKFAYMNFLKKSPVIVEGNIIKLAAGNNSTGDEFKPRFNVPIFMIFTLSDDLFSNHTKINPSQLYSVYINKLKERILDVVKAKNRFREQEQLILYHVDCLLRDISPSREILKHFFLSKRNGFWAKYAEVLLKASLLEVLLNDKKGFL